MTTDYRDSAEELRALRELKLTVPLTVAGRFLGYGRETARLAAADSTFPCPVRRIGRKLVVNKIDLLKALGKGDLIAEIDAHIRPAEPIPA